MEGDLFSGGLLSGGLFSISPSERLSDDSLRGSMLRIVCSTADIDRFIGGSLSISSSLGIGGIGPGA